MHSVRTYISDFRYLKFGDCARTSLDIYQIEWFIRVFKRRLGQKTAEASSSVRVTSLSDSPRDQLCEVNRTWTSHRRECC